MGVNFSEFFIHCIRATPSGGANRYYRAKRKVANFISQNWGTDWEQLFKNHTKLHLLSKRLLSAFNQLFSGVNIYIPTIIVTFISYTNDFSLALLLFFFCIQLRSTEVAEQQHLCGQQLKNSK